MTVLVTGTAGFIGSHVAERLLARSDHAVGFGVDDDDYDVRLKEARLERLARHPGYRHARADLADPTPVHEATADAERVSDRPAAPDPDWDGAAPNPAGSKAPWRVFNIGSHTPV